MEAVLTWPKPKNKSQLRTFLGLVGYYRRFVKDFATRAAPLTECHKKKSPDRILWTKAVESAWQDLRQALCEEPVLQAPDYRKPFVLQTDTSRTGLGAVLSQVVEREEKPILYLSRKLLPRECYYSTVEQECLAIKWAVESLRYYLLG